MGIYLTKDSFVWLDITKQCKRGGNNIEEQWIANHLYAVDPEDDTEYLLESIHEVEQAVNNNLRICIEVGEMPQQKPKREGWFNKAKKIVHKGYVYVKYNDITFGKV